MARLCRVVTTVFLIIYGLALALYLVSTLGLFGQQPDPLSGVFLVPIGLPWILLVDRFPEPLWPWLAGAAPLINYAILKILCTMTRYR